MSGKLLQYWLMVLWSLLLAACAGNPRAFPAPAAAHYEQAQVPGFNDIRFWGDRVPPQIDKMIAKKRQIYLSNKTSQQRFDVLALSGGGEDGAYGAGFLKGWSKRGDRPEFSLVTGISTGALIAPFAFLGPKYDDTIKRFYTGTSKYNIFTLTPFTALLGGSAVGNNVPLRKLIRTAVSDEVVAAIAQENRRGRLLFIGTTNLDAQRPVIWDIGSIAESGHPRSAQLIADIMLASAAIPGVFPPVNFDVTVAGKRRQEVHVDGGVTNQIFVYPAAVNVGEIDRHLGINPRKTFWLVRNTKIDPVYDAVDLGAMAIVERSISTLIKYQGRGDLMMLEKLAKRDGFALRLTYVPQDFSTPLTTMFDPVYMRDLYQVGYHAALGANPWQNQMPQANIK